jgi:hypothetical protein
MSLVVEQPQLPTPAALSDELSLDPAPPEDGPIESPAAFGPIQDPPSELLLAAASLVVWAGMAMAFRRLLARRLART